ncbi:unnamed protein product [Peniophora sp. CBMAI 1063]|nr:unnamed protein product [Peniophora sp. CBMAI 1063]
MPRENSFSDEGRSLTPSFSDREDEEEEHGIVRSPVSPQRPTVDTTSHAHPAAHTSAERTRTTSNVARSPNSEDKSRHHFLHLHRPTHVSIKQQYGTPKERFRAAAHKVMAMRRASFHMVGNAIGAEPGVDVRRDTAAQLYGGVRARCMIEVMDYSPLRTTSVTMGNAELARWAEDDTKSRRPAWAKVRWINIAGISYDVITALALKYDMHPLALEDLLHQRAQARSKADYYAQHMFLRVLTHTLGDNSDNEVSPVSNASSKTPTWSSGTTLTNLPRSASPEPMDGEKSSSVREEERPEYDGSVDPYADAEAGESPSARRNSSISSFNSRTRKVAANAATLAQLKAADRVDVRLAPLSIFMYPDGTIITFHPGADLSFTAPITARVRQRDTSLRRTGDSSLLVQSLLDLVVDRTLEVTEEYHRRIQRLERVVLIKPKVSTVRALHVLSGDLILHKRTMGPIKTLVYGLRRYDADRCAAVMSLGPGEKFSYMTPKANVYLADVHDHMEYALASLDMYAAMTENLIGYTFNMASYDMNNVMRSLTLVTVIFFPLTLLTGYFGMNFQFMWSIGHGHSDILFWEIALPVLAICIPLFLWGDIMRVAHYLKKRWLARRIKKNVTRDGKWRKMA